MPCRPVTFKCASEVVSLLRVACSLGSKRLHTRRCAKDLELALLLHEHVTYPYVSYMYLLLVHRYCWKTTHQLINGSVQWKFIQSDMI